MRAMAMVMMLLIGCGDGADGIMPPPDGRPDDASGVFCQSFGEACRSESFPVNTVCHDGMGWCVDDVCRPMCSSRTKICADLVVRYAPAGAGYCEPR